MLYGIAVFPSQAVQDFANSWRIRHDPHYSIIPPHMTVREKEELSDIQLPTIIEHLQTVASEMKPFQITFNRVSSFYPASHVLYLALKDPTPMIRLHEAVCSGPLHVPAPNFVYTPHVTIGQNMPPDELHDLYGNLRMSSVNLTTEIDQLHLLRKTASDMWHIDKTFLFEG
ncbi:2'-5' RNA ligase family protein [Paenibacillus glycanilyticus]|uniref:Putative phosphoesterase MU1_26470 n=1 Tax=Paenibacillus glycanilyticus TaxID=126569 RepID=A0ABQ6GGX2_9BACL|nr:2'-5' RNA ligase family protein [Paenibacillus glycanilyticus]GLX68302.1 putative phosphoesterase YjcG [Paenibacillus glycanilyticus]